MSALKNRAILPLSETLISPVLAKRMSALKNRYEVEAALASRLSSLRDVDEDTYSVVLACIPALQDLAKDATDLALLIDVIALVAVEAPDCSVSLATRLQSIPEALSDLECLRKWAVHGLQRYKDQAAQRLFFFSYEDPNIFSDQRTEIDSAQFIRRRDMLQSYLSGFGVNDCRLELHDPQAVNSLLPSVSVSREIIRFPRRIPEGSTNQSDALYRAAIAHAAAHFRHSEILRPAGARHPTLLALISLVEDARVEHLMVKDYPGLHSLWGQFHTATRESAGFDLPGLSARLARALHDPYYQDKNAWVQSGLELFSEALLRDPYDQKVFDSVGRKLAISAEKMRQHMPENYRPAPVYRDDNLLLWDMNPTYQDDDRVVVSLKDVQFRELEEDISPSHLMDVDMRRKSFYPEWDHRLDVLRDDWVTVIEPPSSAIRYKAFPKVRANKVDHQTQRRVVDRAIRLTKLAEGDELDLNAIVDNAIDMRSGTQPDGRIFRRHGRRRKSSAIVVLMDQSQSTERYATGTFTTVLDIEKAAARLVTSSLHSNENRVALHSFSSNGRHQVHYRTLKDFDEDFGVVPQENLDLLRGGMSTRMGAALRHASAMLSARSADYKVILMLTDGQPSDVDVLEDDYLIADTSHAVLSASAHGIQTFCLTLDRRADAYVQKIFGVRNYLIADDANAFAGYTGKAIIKLISN